MFRTIKACRGSTSLAALLLVASCGQSTGPKTAAPVPAPVEPSAHERVRSTAVATPPTSGTLPCFMPMGTATIRTSDVNISSCAQWNHFAQVTGTVHIGRWGSHIVFDFGKGIGFTGLVENGTVSAVHIKQEPWQDGCTWRATESLVGTLNPTTCQLELRYRYIEEAVVVNDQCATGCAGTASVTAVELTD